MNLMFEDLARCHQQARLAEARQGRRAVYLKRVHRLARKAKRVDERQRLVLARAA